jgi:hypothetical protein
MAPSSYQGVPVPAEVAAAWKTWAGAEWRKQTWTWANNNYDYPDQRFGIDAPSGMCTFHLDMRRRYRDQYFNDRTGSRWPGTAGSPFTIIDSNIGRELAWRKREWDEKASEQMRLTEECCLSGRSSQCRGMQRTCMTCARLRRNCRCEEFTPFLLDTSKGT